MARNRQQISHTLPRNFTFHYTDGEPPRTPERADVDEVRQPPQPPRQPYRLKRRREHRVSQLEQLASLGSSDVPVPTIEVAEAPSSDVVLALSIEAPQQPVSLGFGSLARSSASPPITPRAQVFESTAAKAATVSHWEKAEVSSQGDSISRPSTACSGFSDSSVSSSIESFPSFGGSFTSPETDFADHMVADIADKSFMLTSPLQSYGDQPMSSSCSVPAKTKQIWSEEMDNHLWMTYMRYLQDPTHTPFKMLPGTAPPLGVCSRIVREAKRTWKGPRASGAVRAYKFMPWGQRTRADSPDTIKPTDSGSSTPTRPTLSKSQAPWPRSDSSTRRRLRELCKRKPTLSAHYNRLLHTRSPSPFMSTGSRSSSAHRELPPPPFSPLRNTSTFSTRDMNMSLATSTSVTMQPGNDLNRLAAELVTPKPADSDQFTPHGGRSSAHQKSHSLQLSLGISGMQHQGDMMLASPFEPDTCRNRQRSELVEDGPESGSSRLASPLRLAAPVGQSRSFRRRIHEDACNLDAVTANDIFGPYGGIATRRARTRGFSLGDVSETSRRLSSLFAPPSATTAAATITTTTTSTTIQQDTSQPSVQIPGSTLLPPPSFDRTRRLGSPFAERPSKPHFNTFPRNFSLQGLEPALELHEERTSNLDSTNFTEAFSK